MHKYLKAIGFQNIVSEREWNNILFYAENEPDKCERVFLEEGMELCEIRKSFGTGIGIKSCGIIYDEDEKRLRENYFPYFEGSGITSYADIAIERRVDTHNYIGICEDIKMNVDLIFHLQNAVEYMRNQQFTKDSVSVTFSGLANSGKILFPVLKSKEQMEKYKEEHQSRMMLVSAAREGDPEAIETLTMEDIDIYSEVSRRIQNEDVYSIVDTHFMPYGLEYGQYSVLGEILDFDIVENNYTREKLYVMNLDINGLQFDICAPVENVMGEPAAGRRFKGNIWLQGYINF